MAACIPKGAQGLPEKYPPMVHTVVTHMAQDPTQKPTQSIDLQMLTKLAMPDVAVKGAQALVAAAGGLQAVYRAMQEHQHGAEVQAQACLALSVVACERPDNQFRLMEFEPADVAKYTPVADGGMSGIERTAVFVASQADVRPASTDSLVLAKNCYSFLEYAFPRCRFACRRKSGDKGSILGPGALAGNNVLIGEWKQTGVRTSKRQKAENARAAFQHLARTVGEGQWDAVCEADPTRPTATPRGHHASARRGDSEPELVGASGRGRRGWG